MKTDQQRSSKSSNQNYVQLAEQSRLIEEGQENDTRFIRLLENMFIYYMVDYVAWRSNITCK